MTYPTLNGTAMGSDLGYFLIYLNNITHGYFMPAVVTAFFLISLIGSLLMQQRFTGTMRIETSLAASSFVTFGFAILLEQRTGLLSGIYFAAILTILIISVIFLIFKSDE